MGVYVGTAAVATGTYAGTVVVAYDTSGGGGGTYAADVYIVAGAGAWPIASVACAATRFPANNDVVYCCAVANVLCRSLVSAVIVLIFSFSTWTLALFTIFICAMIWVVDPRLLSSIIFAAPW